MTDKDTSRRRAELLKALPKIELHLHLEGSIQPATALALARKNGVALPPCDSPAELYAYDTLDAFLAVYDAIAASVIDTADFHRITYEMLQSAAANGARYVEFFVSLGAHKTVPFERQFDGIRAGMGDAARDFGIPSAIVPGINREESPARASECLDRVLANRGDDLIGIGLDYFEAPYPPEPFAAVYQRAKREGLHLTAHAGEAGPAPYVAGAIDVLGVERIDHGYNILEDPALVERCRDMGLLFTCCPSTTLYTTPHKDLSAPDHPIRGMREAGLTVCINSDDPPMFLTDLGNEYLQAMEQLGFDALDIKRSIYATIDHAWVDDSTRASWRADWGPEIERITRELSALD